MKKCIVVIMVLCTLGSAFAVDIDWENSGYIKVPETDRFDRPTGRYSVVRYGEHTFSNNVSSRKTDMYGMSPLASGAAVFLIYTYNSPIFEFDGAEYTMYALRKNGTHTYEVPMIFVSGGLAILPADWAAFVNGVNDEITKTPGNNQYRIIIEKNDSRDTYDLGYVDLTWQKAVQDFVKDQN